MKKRLTLAPLTIILGCSLIWPLAMLADSAQWEKQVRVKLAALAVLMGIADATMSHDPYIGSLRNNTYTDLTLTLHKGVNYALVGVCDTDCDDLDIKLYNDDGQLVGQDTKPDNTPIVGVVPAHTQEFTLRMVMSRCNNNPCFYGVGVYSHE